MHSDVTTLPPCRTAPSRPLIHCIVGQAARLGQAVLRDVPRLLRLLRGPAVATLLLVT